MSYHNVYVLLLANNADKLLAAFYLCCLSTTILVVCTLGETVAIYLSPQTFVCSDHFSQGRSIFRRQKLDRAVHFLPRINYRVTGRQQSRDFIVDIRAKKIFNQRQVYDSNKIPYSLDCRKPMAMHGPEPTAFTAHAHSLRMSSETRTLPFN